MNKEELMQFVEWLPNNVEEFKGMDPDQIVNTLNKLSESEEGIATLNELMSTYKKSKQMFRKGGKIEYLVGKFQEGGEVKKYKKSDDFNRKEWRAAKRDWRDLGLSRHDAKISAAQELMSPKTQLVSTSTIANDVLAKPIIPSIEYTASKQAPVLNITNGFDYTSLGSFDKAFAAARKAGLNNFTWNGQLFGTELGTNKPKYTIDVGVPVVSEVETEQTKTVESPTTDSSEPPYFNFMEYYDPNYKYVITEQTKTASTPVKSTSTTVAPWRTVNSFISKGGEGLIVGKEKTAKNGYTYTVVPADTLGNVVYRKIFRQIPNGFNVTTQKQIVNYPDSTSYLQFHNVDPNAEKGNPTIIDIGMPKEDRWWRNQSEDRKIYDAIFKELYNYK